MPLGTPRVPFEMPGPEERDFAREWEDVYTALYKKRVLFLCQEVKSEIVNQLIGSMIYLSENFTNDREIKLIINSYGGFIRPGLQLYDTMKTLNCVSTICLGVSASVASLILLGGRPSKRAAMPHATIMVHQPTSVYRDEKTGEYNMEAGELSRMKEYVIQEYVERTKQSYETIWYNLTNRDRFMTAQDAKEFGLIDRILSGDKDGDLSDGTPLDSNSS